MDKLTEPLRAVSSEASSRLETLKAELVADFERQVGRAEYEAENWTPNYDLESREISKRKEGSLRDRWESALREEKKGKAGVSNPTLTRQHSQPPPYSPVTAEYPSHSKAVAISGSTRDLEQKIKRLDEENKRLREHLVDSSSTPHPSTATPTRPGQKSGPHYLDKEYMQAVAVSSSTMTAYDLQGHPHASLSQTFTLSTAGHQVTPKSVACTPIPDDFPRHTPARTNFSLAPIPDPLPDDQYELTAWEDSDAEGKSRAEREEERKGRRAKKHVPPWCNDWVGTARGQWRIDPDSVFYCLKHFPKCDLALVFGDGGKKKRRGSSGNWGVDGLTDTEISAYRMKMGQTERV